MEESASWIEIPPGLLDKVREKPDEDSWTPVEYETDVWPDDLPENLKWAQGNMTIHEDDDIDKIKGTDLDKNIARMLYDDLPNMPTGHLSKEALNNANVPFLAVSVRDRYYQGQTREGHGLHQRLSFKKNHVFWVAYRDGEYFLAKDQIENKEVGNGWGWLWTKDCIVAFLDTEHKAWKFIDLFGISQ